MLQFVRQISISLKIQKTLSHRRGFLFHVAAGFSGEVNPMSGMIVNLVEVDAWLQEIKTKLESENFETDSESLNLIFVQIFAEGVKFLKAKGKMAKVELASLVFREERGFGFASHLVPVSSSQDVQFFSSHFLELVPPGAPPQLLKVQMHWQHRASCEADYFHESFKLLKPLALLNSDELLDQVTLLKGHILASGSVLSKIGIQDLGKGLTLEM